MPRNPSITKEQILKTAIDIVREGGSAALNVRAIATRLSSSVQPIFYNYGSIDELRRALITETQRMYSERTEKEVRLGRYNPYKATGIAYVDFATDEPELFKLLFMRDREVDGTWDEMPLDPILALISESLGISTEEARLFHLEMWTFVHGVASMIATGYYSPEHELVSKMLTDVYEGLKYRFGGAK